MNQTKEKCGELELDAIVRLDPEKRIKAARSACESNPHLLEELSTSIGRKEYMESLGLTKKIALVPVILANIAALTAIFFTACSSILTYFVHGKESVIAFIEVMDVFLVPSFLVACAVKLLDRKLNNKMSLKIKEARDRISKLQN